MIVRLRSKQQVLIKGELTMCNPGDYVEVGRQQAMRWIADGLADAPHLPKAGMLPTGCGVVGFGPQAPQTLRRLETQYEIDTLHWTFEDWMEQDLRIPFLYTLFWHGDLPLRDELLVPGFNLLYTWWAAYPLFDYDTLASQIGSDEARQHTLDLIHDLRVPLPNPALLFIKRNTTTQRLIDTWLNELQNDISGDDARLSLLRALYRVPGLWWPLPYTWGVKDGKDKYDG